MTLFKSNPDDFVEFSELTRGYIELYIVDRFTAPSLLLAFMDRDPNAACIVHAIDQLVAKIRPAKPGHGPLCLDCETEFHGERELPTAWMVMVPFANPRAAIVTAICEACASTKDLNAASLRVVRKLWPSAIVDTSRNKETM